MHSWRIARRGGRLERVRTNSSVDVCQTFETRLSTQVQILTWRTSQTWTTWRITTWRKRTFEGLRGALLFHLVSPSLQISLVVLPGRCLALVWVLVFSVVFGLVVWVLFFVLGFASREIWTQSIQFPVVDRPCLVLVRHCRKKKRYFFSCYSMFNFVDFILLFRVPYFAHFCKVNPLCFVRSI